MEVSSDGKVQDLLDAVCYGLIYNILYAYTIWFSERLFSIAYVGCMQG